MPSEETTCAMPDHATQIGKLIPRLASDHDGEVVATVRAIMRVLKTAGLDLHDLARVIKLPGAGDGDEPDWRTLLRACRAHMDELTRREVKFIESLSRWRGAPTEKQRAWLAAIYDRQQEARAA